MSYFLKTYRLILNLHSTIIMFTAGSKGRFTTLLVLGNTRGIFYDCQLLGSDRVRKSVVQIRPGLFMTLSIGFARDQKVISLKDTEFEKLGRPTVGDSLHVTMEMTHHLKVVEDSERQAIIDK